MLIRVERLKMLAALNGLLGVELPGKDWELVIDEKYLALGTKFGGANKAMGRIDATVHIDLGAVWRGLKLVDPAGNIYTTSDQGKTWENGWQRITKDSLTKRTQS
jgi:hypothetical protein